MWASTNLPRGRGSKGGSKVQVTFPQVLLPPVATKATGVKKVTVDTGHTWATGD